MDSLNDSLLGNFREAWVKLRLRAYNKGFTDPERLEEGVRWRTRERSGRKGGDLESLPKKGLEGCGGSTDGPLAWATLCGSES